MTWASGLPKLGNAGSLKFDIFLSKQYSIIVSIRALQSTRTIVMPLRYKERRESLCTDHHQRRSRQDGPFAVLLVTLDSSPAAPPPVSILATTSSL